MSLGDPVTRRDALKQGAKMTTVAIMAAMLTGPMGGGLSQGAANGLYIRKNISADEVATNTAGAWRFRAGLGISDVLIIQSNDGTISTQIQPASVLMTGFTSLGDILLLGATDADTGNSVGLTLGVLSPGVTRSLLASTNVLYINGLGLNLDDGGSSTTATITVDSHVPAQIGLPTSTAGIAVGLNRPDHRHAFSGRFAYAVLDPAAILPGGVFPDNIARIKINNAWTLRRIWVYTKNGPTGGTETYGIVNAAGALQGTAVVLPAGPGISQAESALQVTNLTGGTLYYVAQTGAGAGVVAASVNTQIGLEYTMNV